MMRADAKRNRERILEAAECTFAKEGLAVPMEVVAKAAGVGVGTLYRHFSSKEALFEAIVIARIEAVRELIRAGSESPHPESAFFTVLEGMIREGARKKDFFDALAVSNQVPETSPEVAEEFLSGLQKLLERAQGAGAVRPDVTVAEVFSLATGSCAATGDSLAGPCSLDLVIRVLMAGLRPDPD